MLITSREDSLSASGGEETGSQGAGRVVTFTTDNLANRIALFILGGMRVTRFVLSRDYAEVYLGKDHIANPRRMMRNDAGLTGYLKEIGEAFRLGSGVLGKSAIAIGILIAVGGLAIFRLKSDGAILVALGVIIVAFFLWFFPVIRFVDKHPDAALLEGAEWRGWKQFEASAKGYVPQLPEKEPMPLPGSQAALPGSKLTLPGSSEPDEEPKQ